MRHTCDRDGRGCKEPCKKEAHRRLHITSAGALHSDASELFSLMNFQRLGRYTPRWEVK